MGFSYQAFVNVPLTHLYQTFFDLRATHWPISLCAHETSPSEAPLVSSVWATWSDRPPPAKLDLHIADRAGMESQLALWRAYDVYPRLVAAYGKFPNATYIVVAAAGPPTLLNLYLNRDDLANPIWHPNPGDPEASGILFTLLEGYYPVSASLYGLAPERVHAAIIWQRQPTRATPPKLGHIYWGLNIVENVDLTEYDRAVTSGFAHGRLFCPLQSTDAGPLRLAIHRDDGVPGLGYLFGLTHAETTLLVAETLPSWGRWPLAIQGTSAGSKQRFDVVFANEGETREEPRTLRIQRLAGRQATAQGPLQAQSATTPEPPRRGPRVAAVSPPRGDIIVSLPVSPNPNVARFHDVDTYVVDLMKRGSVRAAQLAVAYEGRLVHAAAYTRSQPSYPTTEVLHRMRVGSISKVITNMALAKLAQDRSIDLFEKTFAQSLGLSSAAGPGWNTRTLAQAAYHTAYFAPDGGLGDFLNYFDVANWLVGQGLADANALASEPLTRAQHFAYLATHAPPAETALGVDGYFEQRTAGALPPSPAPLNSGAQLILLPQYVYSNFGVSMLQDVIRTEGSAANYLDYLRFLFSELGVPPERIQETVSTAALAAQSGEEVRYHASYPNAEPSIFADGRTPVASRGLAPLNYEWADFRVGHGGGYWSLATVDLVRLISSLDLPSNPLGLSPATRDLLVGPVRAVGVTGGRTLAFFTSDWPKHVPPGGGRFGEPAQQGPLTTAPVVAVDVTDVTTHRVLHHTGQWPGTVALTFRRDDGVVVALTLNVDLPGWLWSPVGPQLSALLDAVQAKGFPSWDLFNQILE